MFGAISPYLRIADGATANNNNNNNKKKKKKKKNKAIPVTGHEGP
jgi:hypothetical protein